MIYRGPSELSVSREIRLYLAVVVCLSAQLENDFQLPGGVSRSSYPAGEKINKTKKKKKTFHLDHKERTDKHLPDQSS